MAAAPRASDAAALYYDGNGNMTGGAGATLAYDVSNRLFQVYTTSGGYRYYSYAPDNKRIYEQVTSGTGEWVFYSPSGRKMGLYTYNASSGWSLLSTNTWFGRKLLADENGSVYQDRVGTNRAGGARFYPYGEEITSTANDHEKFATYTRDGYTGFDYADQRYYASAFGSGGTSAYYRFLTPDPSQSSAGPSNPGSWNRYAYAGGEPVNRGDPSGLDWEYSYYGGWCSTLDYYGGCYEGDPGSLMSSPPTRG